MGFAGVSIAMATTSVSARSNATAKPAGRSIATTCRADPVDHVPDESHDGSAMAVAPARTDRAGPDGAATVDRSADDRADDKPYFAIGESVMLGAKPVLDARGITTVAEVSKGPDWELNSCNSPRRSIASRKASSSSWAPTAPSPQAQYEAVLIRSRRASAW